MTTFDPPPDELDADELAVHAVLDGEATAEERRRIARDPHLRARVEEMRAVAAAIGEEPAPPDDDVLARLRSTALASLDDDELVPAGDAEPDAREEDVDGRRIDAPLDSVTALPPRRARRSLPALPAVAAVILVLVLVGIGLIASSQNDDDQSADAGSSGVIPDSETGQSAASTTALPSSADEEPAPEANPGSGSTGGAAVSTFSDDDALRQTLQTVDPETLDLPPGGASGAPPQPDEAIDVEAAVARCASVLQASNVAIGEVQASALVEVDGTLLLVLSTPVAATERGPASTRLTVLEAESCVPRFGVQRDP